MGYKEYYWQASNINKYRDPRENKKDKDFI